MLGISLTVLFSALAAFAVWSYYINPALKSNVKKDNNAMYIIAAAAVAFILRLILGAVYRGHNTDMSCFIGWSNAFLKTVSVSFTHSICFTTIRRDICMSSI